MATIYDTLRMAMDQKRCIKLSALGQVREVCPHAIGMKDKRRRVLVYQYTGGSKSGLAQGGAWRCFFLEEIIRAEIIPGAWQSGPNPVAKTEASLDRVDHQVR